MQSSNRTSLWSALSGIGDLSHSFLLGPEARVELGDLIHGSAFGGRAAELRGRSVLVATSGQLAAAVALTELDGVARRLVLCPPDLPPEHIPFIVDSAGVDAIVSDMDMTGSVELFRTGSPKIEPADWERDPSHQTEWILLTSGTTGLPKLVVHTLASLAGAIKPTSTPANDVVWSTFYDIRRYGGLQIFLRAVLTGASLVLSSAQEPAADFLLRASQRRVTHISGTPSHWGRALMSPAAHMLAPRYIRLSGEIVDQAILNRLQSVYPQAKIVHAFASTEAGLAFEVDDRMAGFPQDFVGHHNGVEMKIEDSSLRIRSSRTAARYMGSQNKIFQDTDGFVDTGDVLEPRGDRYYFMGRRDGVINVGGLKVHPEEVEAVINQHPMVRMSLVRTRKNPITGALVVADVVLEEPAAVTSRNNELQNEILQLCRKTLPRHKVPTAIRFVPTVTIAATGKMARQNV